MTSRPIVHIHCSNRIEALADALATLLGEAPAGPFAPEVVVVQGRGMAKWLSMQLARRHGVSANVEFVYPRRYVERTLGAVLGDPAALEGLIAEERLLWAVAAELPGRLADQRFARLAHYLRDDPKGIRRLQLSQRVAAELDQYLTYRPEMVLAWEQREDGGVPPEQRWQPALWRSVSARCGGRHLARLERELHDGIAAGAQPAALPARVTVFGVSSLPPLFVRVLGAAARFVETHLLLFSPSPEPWWEPDHADRTAGDRPAAALLRSLGPLGAEFRQVLQTELDRVGARVVEEDRYRAPEPRSCLTRLARDTFEPTRPSIPRPALAVGGPAQLTPSLTVHRCHSPMREVEVLRDQLLALLTGPDTTLTPQDVVVLMPDVDRYAPFVEAVFGRDARSDQFIPFRVADRSVRADSPVIEAFERLLELASSRLPASSVMDLLSLAPVAAKFGIEPDDVPRLTSWVAECGIRWGIDAAHRAQHGQPAVGQNTWRFGLDRLLLGYCMPTGGRHALDGVLPYDEVEGRQAEQVGNLGHFAETLFERVAALEAPRPLGRWQQDLGELLDGMIAEDRRDPWQHQRIREGLAELAADAAAGGFDGDVHLAAVRPLLRRYLDTAHPERGFLAGGVTFCAMVPMRSIPFRVVCLLGMNDGEFPRPSGTVDFDLLRHGPGGPQPGDRDRRKDDRYLFLESLLAAREQLIVTYTGQSIRDNTERPPAVVLDELYDYLAASWDPSAPYRDEADRVAQVRRQLEVRHPLQGFSRRYFDGSDPRLWSYAATYRQGAEQLVGERHAPPPFFVEPLPALADEAGPPTVSLAELARFFEDPVAYLLQRRLNLFLGDDEAILRDREPVELDRLEQYQLGRALLERRLEGASVEQSHALARASGALPIGTPGRCRTEALESPVEQIAEAVSAWRRSGARPSVAVRAELPGGTAVAGELVDLWGRGQLAASFSKVKTRRLLAAWVRHLALCLSAPDGQERTTTVIGRAGQGDGAKQVLWGPIDEPTPLLRDLIEVYWAGQRAPLRFTPEASHTYADRIAQGDSPPVALRKARGAYDKDELRYSPHFRQVFGDAAPPFTEVEAAALDFEELALRVFGPLLAALQPVGGPRARRSSSRGGGGGTQGSATRGRRG